MPNYAYVCSACQNTFERMLALVNYQDPQMCVCGALAERLISPVGVVLKGDGWTGKNLRIRGQMERKNQRLSAKSGEKAREAPTAKLVPNVGGEETGTWREAQKMASSQGKDPSSYAPLVRQETR